VLTNCDSYERFPPFPFQGLPPIARIPGAMPALSLPFRAGPIRRAAYRPFAKRPIPPELVDDWVAPSLQGGAIRRDVRKFTAGMHKRHTLEAAERFGELEVPVLLAWAPEDRVFKLRDAERLAAAIPRARLEKIADAKTFVPLDRPERLAELIRGFAASNGSL
jgi:pimeloyl-ACP methyl ester carboxylesterase